MSSEPFTLKWGILATGGIAKKFVKDLLINPSTRDASDVRHQVVAAASSTSATRAQEFLSSFDLKDAKAYGSYEELANDTNVNIIYIATPHSHHYQNARLCLEAGKHLLIEKPITVNAPQASILHSIAKQKKLFLMEAVWTRFFPLAREVREFIKSGKLGTVQRLYADLSFWVDVEKDFGGNESRLVNMDLAGGVLLDLGLYPLTWVFQILYHIVDEEEARGAPKIASSISKYQATGCDEQTSIILTFPPNGAHAIATTSIRVATDVSPSHPHTSPPPVRIQGSLGDLLITGSCARPTSYTLVPASSPSRGTPASFEFGTVEHPVPGGGHGMFWEADECARCVRDGRLESKGMPVAETVEVMRVMDEVRRQGGVRYSEGLEGTEYPIDSK